MLIGLLGDDAKIETALSSKRYVDFSLANQEKIKGEKHVTWYKCFINNPKIVDGGLIPYLQKGCKVLVTGRVTAEIYNGQNGNVLSYSMSVQSIEFLAVSATQRPVDDPAEKKPEPPVSTESKDDDDLPF